MNDHDYERDDRCDDEANDGLAIKQAYECARRHGVPFTGVEDDDHE
jgi:hypothetical protein